MKTRHIASGIAATVGLIASLGITGCGADVGDQGAEAEIGSTSQAVINTGTALFLPGFIKLDATHTLVLGGYNSLGNAVATAGIYTSNSGSQGAWNPLVDDSGDDNAMPLPTALGEVKIAPIDTNKFLVHGGRAALDGAASDKSWILTLNVGGSTLHHVAWSANVSDTARAGHGLAKCGSNKVLAIGGATTGYMENLSTGAATTSLRVAAIDGTGKPTWSALQDSNNDTIALASARAYPQVISWFDGTNYQIRISGGVVGGSPVNTSEKLTLDSNCKATTNLTSDIPASGGTLPAALAMAGVAELPAAFTLSSVTYEDIIAGGENAASENNVTNVVYVYDRGADSYVSSGFTLGTARALPVIVLDSAAPTTSVAIMGGIVNSGTTLLRDSTNAKSTFLTTSSGSLTNGTITTARFGMFAHDSANYGFGATYTTGTLSVLADVQP